MLDPSRAAIETRLTNFYAPVSGRERFLSSPIRKRRIRNASYARRTEIFEKFKNAVEM